MKKLIYYISKTTPKKPEDVTVGIPRAMSYHEDGKLWENFFVGLGCNVILSPETNRSMLDEGVRNSSNETCLPVKVLAGHVLSLEDKADYIFIPRYVSTDKMEFSCPKFCGLPDMVRMSLKKDLPIMEVAVDFNNGMKKTDESLKNVAETLKLDERFVRDTFISTVRNRIRPEMEAGVLDADPERPSIAVLGHPYMIHDGCMSLNLIKKLKSNNYQVLTPDNLGFSTKKKNAYPFSNTYFYGIGYENLGSAFTFASLPSLRGIIYLTPFACGIDSLVTEFIERHLKTVNESVPFMKLTVDEHTGEAGVDTRLEAFLDMIAI